VKGNFHARFCNRGGGSDPLVYCNRTAYSVRSFLAPASGSSSPGALGHQVAQSKDIMGGGTDEHV
jgi:hypothetical protein